MKIAARLALGFVLAFTFALAAPADFNDAWLYNFTAEEYVQLRDLCDGIVHRYDPEKYLYVGVGRSPTPLIAYFQSKLGARHAINFPIGGLSYANPDTIWSNTEARARLIRHFDKFFPSAELLHGRQVLLIDFVTSGRSLKYTNQLLRLYLEEKGATVKVHALGLYGRLQLPEERIPEEYRNLDNEEFERAWRALAAEQPVVYKVPDELAHSQVDLMKNPEMLVKKMNFSLYDDHAEFDAYVPSPFEKNEKSEKFEPRPDYAKFREEITGHIKRDSALAKCTLWQSLFKRFNSK